MTAREYARLRELCERATRPHDEELCNDLCIVARTAVPELLAENERLRVVLESISIFGHQEAECRAYFDPSGECSCWVGIARAALTEEVKP